MKGPFSVYGKIVRSL